MCYSHFTSRDFVRLQRYPVAMGSDYINTVDSLSPAFELLFKINTKPWALEPNTNLTPIEDKGSFRRGKRWPSGGHWWEEESFSRATCIAVWCHKLPRDVPERVSIDGWSLSAKCNKTQNKKTRILREAMKTGRKGPSLIILYFMRQSAAQGNTCRTALMLWVFYI